MLVIDNVVHFGMIILFLHLIWLELHIIMSTELSWGLKRRMAGHSISGEDVNNCIDSFEATQRKLTSSLL